MDKEIKFEIDWRILLVKKLDPLLKRFEKAVDKEKNKRAARIQALCEYKTEEEAHEAFGYGCITEDEYRQIVQSLENQEDFANNAVTKNSAAQEALKEFSQHLYHEVRDLKWSMLSDEEKDQIKKNNEQYLRGLKRDPFEKEEGV